MKQITKLEEKVVEKIDTIKSKRPIVYTIEHAEELADLKAQVRKLKALENKSGLRTAAEVGRLAKLPGLVDRIEQIETEDKGWFEDECATLLFGEKIEPAVKEKKRKQRREEGTHPEVVAGDGFLKRPARAVEKNIERQRRGEESFEPF